MSGRRWLESETVGARRRPSDTGVEHMEHAEQLGLIADPPTWGLSKWSTLSKQAELSRETPREQDVQRVHMAERYCWRDTPYQWIE